jgi:hypothetical protein
VVCMTMRARTSCHAWVPRMPAWLRQTPTICVKVMFSKMLNAFSF